MGSRSGRSELGGAKGAAAKSGPSSGEGALSATRGSRAQNKIRKKHDEEKTRSAMGPRGGQKSVRKDQGKNPRATRRGGNGADVSPARRLRDRRGPVQQHMRGGGSSSSSGDESSGKLPLWAVAALKAGEEAKARAAAAAAARAALPPLPHVTLALIADVTHDQVTQQKNKQERQREKHSRGDSAPSGLSALEYLDLSCRGLTRMEGFDSLPNLKALILSSNEIILSRNEISEFPEPPQPLPHLRKLSLSHNKLKVTLQTKPTPTPCRGATSAWLARRPFARLLVGHKALAMCPESSQPCGRRIVEPMQIKDGPFGSSPHCWLASCCVLHGCAR
ncbi:uncharacterized protein LOC34619208 [Cyclospora cayetanensis]|uniref:Uncharacterized protein LOC34619208 n=1 Tax=Cyclospora cayetanensis TaxID=88456 RepID=A0A6P6RRG1_9EIME|nr:uncharacterized protein LOC34619208 [Cyclospora cayetanensis]